MFHRVDWKRPAKETDRSGATYAGNDTTLARSLPVNVQPASAAEVLAYQQKMMEVSHTVYTQTVAEYRHDDRLFYGSRELRIVGVRNLIELDRVIALDCLEYTGGPSKF